MLAAGRSKEVLEHAEWMADTSLLDSYVRWTIDGMHAWAPPGKSRRLFRYNGSS